MGTPRDVLISAFATPPGSMRELSQNVNYFTDPPAIIEVPFAQYMRPEDQGMAAGAFAKSAAALRQSGGGSILGGLLKGYARGFEVRSITLIGFSAGGVFLNEVMKNAADAEMVDGIICLDSLVFNLDWRGNPIEAELRPWVDFGVKAAQNARLLVVAHTEIASPSPRQITTTKGAAQALQEHVLAQVSSDPRLYDRVPMLDEDSFFRAPPPPAVTITGGSTVPPKTFEKSPVSEWQGYGNYWTFNYGGRGPADHIYVSWYAQRDIWGGLLAPRLNSGIQCRSGAVQGLGVTADEEGCRPNRQLVPEGTYTTGTYLWTWAAFLGGLAAGTTAGYLYGKRLGA